MNAMREAKDVIPWKVTDISIRPYEGFWSFNPSIHFDGAQWRCALRCCDYAMPGGVTIRSKTSRSAGQQTKNAMVIFDPSSWAPIQVFKMQEKDDTPRVACPNVGYEDMRIFKTDKGGLQGIAASLHLKRDSRSAAAAANASHQPPEQVLLSFDDEYNIVTARPIRGDGWSGTPQKNWVPFDHCTEPRFLYSIDKGTMFDDRGTLSGDAAVATPSTLARPVASSTPITAAVVPRRAHEAQPERSTDERASRPKSSDHRVRSRGDVQLVRGRRLSLDAATSRPSSKSAMVNQGNAAVRFMGGGRTLLPKYDGLRGGSQLCRVGDDAWLGVGHEMQFLNSKKYYWHTWYLVDARGKINAASAPMKFASNGIEFAAGLAIDGDRAVVSFGVDDMECRLGETRLSAVMEQMRPIKR